MKLQVARNAIEPRVSGSGGLVPYEITPKMISKLKSLGLDNIFEIERKIANNPAKIGEILGKMDPVKSGILKSLLENSVVRNGKLYTRTTDSLLNSIKKVDSKSLGDAAKILDPDMLGLVQAANSQYLGRVPGLNDQLFEIPSNAADLLSTRASGFASMIANASKKTGAMTKRPVSVIPGNSMLSVPSSFNQDGGRVTLNNPLITTPVHELFHVKDRNENLSTKIVPKFGQILAGTALAGTPISILYGNKIADAIPGNIDNAIINAYKYAGPEMYLAGKALEHSPEFYAVKNTKKEIASNPKYYEQLAASYGNPIGSGALQEVQDIKARTYPTGMLTNYGLLRLGTLPLHFAKQASSIHVTPKDYANVGTGIVKKYIDSLKGFIAGVKDPEVAKGILYHDSANKYKSISEVLPATMVFSMLPAIALGEYMRNLKNPSGKIVGPDYQDSIKQGLGA
jgi:hypothetical protein